MRPAVSRMIYWPLILIAIFFVFFRRFEAANLYHPDRQILTSPKFLNLDFEEARFSSKDGVALHGWYVRAAAPPAQPGPRSSLRPSGASGSQGSVPGAAQGAARQRPRLGVILHNHGNAGNIGHRVDELALMSEAGFDVLIYDYRGYGQSGGSPTEKGTYADAAAAYAYLTEAKGVAPESILLFGESLGAAVAVQLAASVPAGGLALMGAFTSVVDMARVYYPILPAKWLVRYRYDSLSKLPGIKLPVLVMHSEEDDIVPVEMGRRLFEAAREPKALALLKGGHNDVFYVDGERIAHSLRAFAAKHLKSRP
ncbi:MAG: alpha/beta hydrolase [Elusimicrobia bacterium]|nr:alpha/beta hydrolase [Elusimicrobiota bacterium]